jgi:diaminohydroxyphosphoribosylaminopyrimidine deaminase/5-amino-6-(5-phosphoribosylamino)uracil reductase
MNDQEYMALALALAQKAVGWTSPNPMVGAVIVKDGRIIGQGYHEKYGDLHAERNALKHCTEDPAGATMYVTLEPCCHHGKQPPCTEAILAAGIRRVVVGSADPNPRVSGGGIAQLRAAGVQVDTGVMQAECDRINYVFFHYITTKTPYVVMKYAMTMDGKIAAYTGHSQWVTGPEAREHVHHDRHRYRGIMVGVGTVLADDPLLTCRIENGRDPIRIVCDSGLKTPLASQLVQTASQTPTIIATCRQDEAAHRPYIQAGCQVLVTPSQDGRIDLPNLMAQLGAQNIDSILLEGGGTLNWSMLSAGLVQRVQAYIAPKLIGGAGAKSPVAGQGFDHMGKAITLKNTAITPLGADILIESEVEPHVHGHS